MPPEDAASLLRQGAAMLGLQADEAQLELLLGYLRQLEKWSRVYNLTAIRDPVRMVTHHLLDSMTVITPLRHRLPRLASVLDVGSGAGFPGAVIAMLMPNVQVTCVDAVEKKSAFVRQAAGELRLSRLQALHGRVETLVDIRPDLIVSRAFASLDQFTTATRHLMNGDSCWLAMKGALPQQEIAALRSDIEVFHVEQVTVPRLQAERHLVWMRMRPSRQG